MYVNIPWLKSERRLMDELKTIIIPVAIILITLLVINIVQNIWILDAVRDMWLSMNRMMDTELRVLKLTAKRLDAHMEALSNINDSQVAIANMILLLTEIEKGKEQNAGQSRCRQDFCDKADVSAAESGSDGRKEN